MRLQTNNNKQKIWILVSDDARLPDPEQFLGNLPAKSMVLLRSNKPKDLRELAGRIIPAAHKLGHRVLLAGPIRLALIMGADGAHLSEAALKRFAIKDLASAPLPKGFILSAAAHGEVALIKAKSAGVDFAFLGTAFASQSHVDQRVLGVLRFSALARKSPLAVVAIGGINKASSKRLGGAGPKLVGFAAIEMFISKN